MHSNTVVCVEKLPVCAGLYLARESKYARGSREEDKRVAFT